MYISDWVSHRASGFVWTWIKNLTKSWNSAEGRLKREKTRTMSWIVNWTTRVSSESRKSCVGFSCSCTTSRTSTSCVSVINSVFGDALVVALQTERAHTHLVHVCLTNDDGAGIFKFFDCSRIDGWFEALEDKRSSTRLHTLYKDIVFDGDWNTVDGWLKLV